jgi:hypothetical protein
MSAPLALVESSLLTYAKTVECLDGGSCLIEDLLNGLLRILSESLLDK